jgi:hypothetical protein
LSDRPLWTQPGYDQQATAEARGVPVQTPAPEGPSVNAPADPLSAFRGALEMPDATEEAMVARIKELRAPKADA